MAATHRSSRSFTRQLEWQARARHVLVGEGQVHKRREPPQPIIIERGEGSHIWDADGNEYIDYLMSFGPIVLGHAYPAVMDAVASSVRRGNVFNVGHPLEIELAEKLVEIIPCAERVSYFVGGSDATSGAIKFARAYTDREKVVRCGYHGWHDWCTPGRGLLAATRQYTLEMTYNDLDSLAGLFRSHPGEIACVIFESANEELPQEGYLEGLVSLAHEHGALAIFDEVKTGFHYALGGAHDHFGITPDMAVYSKAMGNGFGIAAVAGSSEVLDAVADVWAGATFHGEVSLVAAALATIGELEAKDGIAHMWRLGETLLAGYREMVARLGIEHARIGGAGPMPFFGFESVDDERMGRFRDVFYGETLDHGLYLPEGHVWFTSLSHTDEDVARTLEVSEDALKRAKSVV